MAEDIIGSAAAILKEIRKPGPVFVYTKLTPDDTQVIEVKKKDAIRLIIAMNIETANLTFEAHRNDDGLYLGW